MENNYAFIDSQNLNLGIRSLGWEIDFGRFRIYLKEKYSVSRAFLFLGYIETNKSLYMYLRQCGFVLIFKPISKNSEGEYKRNIDADLVLYAMITFYEYDRAIVITSDGDFYSLVRYLRDKNKLACVMSPYVKTCSVLLRRVAGGRMQFMDSLKKKLAK